MSRAVYVTSVIGVIVENSRRVITKKMVKNSTRTKRAVGVPPAKKIKETIPHENVLVQATIPIAPKRERGKGIMVSETDGEEISAEPVHNGDI
jgi:hypothetical protein